MEDRGRAHGREKEDGRGGEGGGLNEGENRGELRREIRRREAEERSAGRSSAFARSGRENDSRILGPNRTGFTDTWRSVAARAPLLHREQTPRSLASSGKMERRLGERNVARHGRRRV